MSKENKIWGLIKRYEEFLQRIFQLIKIVGTLLNNTWVKEETSREILKYFEWNESEYITYQNLWDAVKIVLRGQLNPYVRNEEKI